MAYIDTEKLKRDIRVNLMPNVDIDGTVTVENAERYFLNLIDKTSTADVVEVKHGYWKLTKTEFGWNGCEYPTEYTCTVCGGISPCCEESYCPNCGAKMDGGKAE